MCLWLYWLEDAILRCTLKFKKCCQLNYDTIISILFLKMLPWLKGFLNIRQKCYHISFFAYIETKICAKVRWEILIMPPLSMIIWNHFDSAFKYSIIYTIKNINEILFFYECLTIIRTSFQTKNTHLTKLDAGISSIVSKGTNGKFPDSSLDSFSFFQCAWMDFERKKNLSFWNQYYFELLLHINGPVLHYTKTSC